MANREKKGPVVNTTGPYHLKVTDSLLDHGCDLGSEVILGLFDTLASSEAGESLDSDLAAQLLGDLGYILESLAIRASWISFSLSSTSWETSDLSR